MNQTWTWPSPSRASWRGRFIRAVASALFLQSAVAPGPASAAGGQDSSRVLTREELARAMRQHGSYDFTKTSNSARFDAETFLRLVSSAQEADPERHPLFIDHREWFMAFLEVTGLTESTAPMPEHLSYQHGQDTWIEYRPERVILTAKMGGPPHRALNVRTAWPESFSGLEHYSYLDLESAPPLRVTLHRVVTYHLLDFGDRVVLQDIRGITGRPVTGPLGLLFWLIGEGALMDIRFAIASDGLQVMRGRVRKGLIKLATTATIFPDGKVVKGRPEGRGDLQKIEDRLTADVGVEYVPLP